MNFNFTVIYNSDSGIPDLAEFNNFHHIEILNWLTKISFHISNYTLNHNVTRNFLNNSTEQFDVIILEIFLNDANARYWTSFQCTNHWFINIRFITHRTNILVGTPALLSYVVNFRLSYIDRMTFLQRLVNTWYAFVEFVHA